jgi:hypothetical protein
MKRTGAILAWAFLVTTLSIQHVQLGTAEPAGSAAKPAYFLVQVQNETFVLAVMNEKAIRDAVDCLEGRKRLIPIGEIAMGDGGFNVGHGWHLKPDTVKFAEVAMEVCDGRPSDVGNITARVFCPWTARVTKRLPDKS